MDSTQPTPEKAREEGLQSRWPRLRRNEWVPPAVSVAVLFAAAVVYVPPGICFDDSGDLQLASATLGIMHPPGYPGYVTLGYLVSRVPGVDPAYMVSLACLVSGVAALWICILMQIRLGVDPWLASGLVLALSAVPRVWNNLVAPEVYAPSLLFLVASAYLLIKYARLGVRRDLLLAALLFGVVLANRPTVVWTLPFFLVAWWAASRRRRVPFRQELPRLLGATLIAALPGLYSLGYLWVRDTPQGRFNYIELKHEEDGSVPGSGDGWHSKVQRLYWHVTAREFERYMGNTWHGAWRRLQWIYKQYFLYRPVTFSVVLAVLIIGAVATFKRCGCAFWLLVGIITGNVIFICTYRIYGHAADLTPLLFAATVLGGVAGSVLFRRQGDMTIKDGAKVLGMAVGLVIALFVLGRVFGEPTLGMSPPLVPVSIVLGCLAVRALQPEARKALVRIFMVGMCVVTVVDAPRRGGRSSADAAGFLAELDLPTLPANAMICSMWHQSTPLWYAQRVLSERMDIKIVNTGPSRWPIYIEKAIDHRPVLLVTRVSGLDECKLTRYRNIWRVERASAPSERKSESAPTDDNEI